MRTSATTYLAWLLAPALMIGLPVTTAAAQASDRDRDPQRST